MPLPETPFRCYFALADPYAVEEATDFYTSKGFLDEDAAERVDESLEQNLKAAALLHEEVVFRATASLGPASGPRQHTRKLIAGAKLLLEKGALVPEVRADDEPLLNQLSRPELLGLNADGARECMAIAEVIDAAPKKHEADAPALSQARSAQLVDHLFRQWHFRDKLRQPYLDSSVSYEDLDALFAVLVSAEPVDRKAFVGRCKAMYRNKAHAQLLIQTIYFAMGAIAAEANPIFPDHMARSEKLWSYPELDLAAMPLEARKLADKYGTAERANLPRISDAVDPKNVLNTIGISPDVLDRLDWDDVLRIRERKETKSMRDKVWTVCRSGGDPTAGKEALDAISGWTHNLTSELFKEDDVYAKASKIQFALNILGLGAGLLPGGGSVMSYIGLGADCPLRLPFVTRRITPLSSYSKFVKNTAARSDKKKRRKGRK